MVAQRTPFEANHRIDVAPVVAESGRQGLGEVDSRFGNGTTSSKIDYGLLSPSPFGRATGAGIFRKGVRGGVRGTLFPHFDTIQAEHEAASDHAALYVDITLDW